MGHVVDIHSFFFVTPQTFLTKWGVNNFCQQIIILLKGHLFSLFKCIHAALKLGIQIVIQIHPSFFLFLWKLIYLFEKDKNNNNLKIKDKLFKRTMEFPKVKWFVEGLPKQDHYDSFALAQDHHKSIHLTCSPYPLIIVNNVYQACKAQTDKDEDIPFSYEVGCKIGSGTNATIYRVQEKFGERREIALKVVQRRWGSKKIEKATEYKLMFDKQHPNIIKLYNVHEDYLNMYFMFEFANFGDLMDFSKESTFKKIKGIIKPEQTIDFSRQVSEAVVFCHSHDIVHLDIKQENILLHKQDNKLVCKLCDFGWAMLIPEGYNMETESVGSPYLHPPEIHYKKPFDRKADIWSIGLVMLELLTGCYFFPNERRWMFYRHIKSKNETKRSVATKEVEDTILSILSDYPSVQTKPLSSFVIQCLSYDPDKRPDANTVCDQLKQKNLAVHIGHNKL